MKANYCTRLAKLGATFCSSKFPLLWNSGSVMNCVFRKWLFLWKILIWLENVMRVYCCTRVAQLSTTFCASKFPLLWNSGSGMNYVFRKWVFILKILIWLQNVMRVYCCTRLAQLGATFCSSNFLLLWNSGSVVDCVFRKWLFLRKILIWLENVMRVYCCTPVAQLSTTFCSSKFPILKNPGSLMYCVFRKWVFIWKILMWLESFMMFYYCTRLALRRTTFF